MNVLNQYFEKALRSYRLPANTVVVTTANCNYCAFLQLEEYVNKQYPDMRVELQENETFGKENFHLFFVLSIGLN